MIRSPVDFDTSEFFARIDADEHVQLEKQYAEQKKAAQNRANDKLFEALKKQIERKRVAPLDLEIDSINGGDVDESIVDELIEDEEHRTQMEAEMQQKKEQEELARAEQNLTWYMNTMENIQSEVEEISQKLDQSAASASDSNRNTADNSSVSSHSMKLN